MVTLFDLIKNTRLIVFLFLVFSIWTVYSYTNYKMFATGLSLTLFSLFAYLEYKQNGKNSVAVKLYSNNKVFVTMLAVLLFMTIVMDSIFGVMFKGWAYPNYTIVDYLLAIFVAYPFFWLLLILFTHIIKRTSNNKYAKVKVSKIIPFFAIILMAAAFILALYSLNPWYALCLLFIGFVLFSESLLSPKGLGFLSEIKSGNYSTLVAMLFAVIIFGLFAEGLNLGVYEWRYYNVPFENIEVFSIPIFIFLPGWITLGVGALYTYRLVINKSLSVKTLTELFMH